MLQSLLSENTKIKLKITMIKSSLCGSSDAYILVKGTMTATGGNADAERKADERHKELIFKNCAPFT